MHKKYFEQQPYVFLDIDGVMTNYTDEYGSFKTHDAAHYGVSKSCLDRLMSFLDDTGSKVIISSNWRKFTDTGIGSVWHTSSFGDVQNPLPNIIKQLGDYYAGMLPKVRHVVKSQALDMWFTETGLDYRKARYVIFDDDPREGYAESKFAKRFIMTNPETGLTDADIIRAKNIIMK